MKTIRLIALLTASLFAQARSQTAAELVAAEPYAKGKWAVAAYWKEPANAELADTYARAEIANYIEHGGVHNAKIIDRWWRYSKQMEFWGPTAKAYTVALAKNNAKDTPLLVRFINTPKKYEEVKAAGWVIDGVELMPNFSRCVLALALNFTDFDFVDTFQRAGAIAFPVDPKLYMQFLQWRLVKISSDKDRYAYLQNELTNLMLSPVANVANDPYAAVINKASDLIYLRMRRDQSLANP